MPETKSVTLPPKFSGMRFKLSKHFTLSLFPSFCYISTKTTAFFYLSVVALNMPVKVQQGVLENKPKIEFFKLDI